MASGTDRIMLDALRASKPCSDALDETRAKLQAFQFTIRGHDDEAAARIYDDLLTAIEHEYTLCRARDAQQTKGGR